MIQSTPGIDIDQLAHSAEDDATVIDVRDPGEYVPGATPVPMGQLGRPVETGAPARS